MKDKVTKKECSWYSGPSLVELIDGLEIAKRNPKGPLRIPVLDRMYDQGQLTMFGKIESGTLEVGAKCYMAPHDQPCQVAIIFDSKGNQVRYARPGENCQIKLLGIEDS